MMPFVIGTASKELSGEYSGAPVIRPSLCLAASLQRATSMVGDAEACTGAVDCTVGCAVGDVGVFVAVKAGRVGVTIGVGETIAWQADRKMSRIPAIENIGYDRIAS